MKIENIFKHLHLINKHRWFVFKRCCKAGILLQGLTHDLSKYSPVEFWESVKYYNGIKSPIGKCKKRMAGAQLGSITKAAINIIINIG